MRSRLRLGILCVGYRCAARMATLGFALVARVANAATLRDEAGRDYRVLEVAKVLALETFCCEVKHHGRAWVGSC
jgi:hypothetical protein